MYQKYYTRPQLPKKAGETQSPTGFLAMLAHKNILTQTQHLQVLFRFAANNKGRIT